VEDGVKIVKKVGKFPNDVVVVEVQPFSGQLN
jgi:hypothetical protein